MKKVKEKIKAKVKVKKRATVRVKTILIRVETLTRLLHLLMAVEMLPGVRHQVVATKRANPFRSRMTRGIASICAGGIKPSTTVPTHVAEIKRTARSCMNYVRIGLNLMTLSVRERNLLHLLNLSPSPSRRLRGNRGRIHRLERLKQILDP